MHLPTLLRSLPLLALLLPLLAHAAALVTIVDGEASAVEGSRVVVLAEGVKLGNDAIVRTAAAATLVRLEWPDGTVADLGPDTQAMVNPGGLARGGAAPSLYLLRGWAKLSSLGSANHPGLVAPRVDVQAFKGALVVMAAADETWVFAEAGGAPLVERDLKPASNLALKNGELWLRAGSAKGSVAPRPTPAQMQRVPRGFRDALPLRAAAFKDKPVTPKAAPAPTYAELREWLTAEPVLRKPMPRRFGELARDNAFRAGLVEHLARHPEWEPLLFPERFTKPASAPR